MMRLVVDTNIMLASVGTAAPYRWLFDALLQEKCHLLVTTEILLEYSEVISSRTKSAVAQNVLETLVNLSSCERITAHFHWNIIFTDPDDNKFVDCAIAGNADYIITNDRHFQILSEIDFPRVKAISPEELWQLFA